MRGRKIFFAALLAAGVCFGQTHTDINSPQYYGKTGIPKAYAAIDANFAQVESGSALTPASVTVPGTGLIITGSSATSTVGTAAGYLDGGVIADGTIVSNKVASGAIIASRLADGATLAEIADDDGTGSGLDADLLDGEEASAFQDADADLTNDAGVTGLSVTNTWVDSGGITNTLVFLHGKLYRWYEDSVPQGSGPGATTSTTSTTSTTVTTTSTTVTTGEP